MEMPNSMNDTTVRINLWSGPRNISTALMYSFAQRSDTVVVDEPLYGHYLRVTDADRYHPGAREVLESMETDGEKVLDRMWGDYEKPVVFFKQMTHHLVELDLSRIVGMKHLILTRDPAEMLPSFAKEVPNPTLRDVGYRQHLELLDYLEEQGENPVVLDSKRVLLDPQKTLARLCDAVGIEFDASMLRWEPGPRPEDGTWAKHWYHNVHKSSGFMPYRPKTEPFPENLKPLLEKCRPIYEELSQRSI